MINNIDEGGLRVTHIDSFMKSLKCNWVRRYFSVNESPWKIFFTTVLKPYGNKFFFQCNCSKTDISFIKNIFLRQVLDAWCEVSYAPPNNNFGNEYIWNNSSVKINSKTIFYDILFKKGIMKIADFFMLIIDLLISLLLLGPTILVIFRLFTTGV